MRGGLGWEKCEGAGVEAEVEGLEAEVEGLERVQLAVGRWQWEQSRREAGVASLVRMGLVGTVLAAGRSTRTLKVRGAVLVGPAGGLRVLISGSEVRLVGEVRVVGERMRWY